MLSAYIHLNEDPAFIRCQRVNPLTPPDSITVLTKPQFCNTISFSKKNITFKNKPFSYTASSLLKRVIFQDKRKFPSVTSAVSEVRERSSSGAKGQHLPRCQQRALGAAGPGPQRALRDWAQQRSFLPSLALQILIFRPFQSSFDNMQGLKHKDAF